MTTVENRSSEPFRNVLYDFALAKKVPDAELLDEYVRLYPDYAERLTDFAVQLVLEYLQADAAEAPVVTTRVSPTVSRAMSRFQNALHGIKIRSVKSSTVGSVAAPTENPFAKQGRQDFRRIASELHANAVFLCMVRDGIIVVTTMTPGFLAALAVAMKAPLDDVAAYLRTRQPTVAAGQFYKAEEKPQAGIQLSFEEAVKRSGLTPEQQHFLLKL